MMSRKIRYNLLFLLLALAQPVIFAQEAAATSEKPATVVPYPTPPGLKTSALYSVSVNSMDIWTEQVGGGGLEDLHVASFSGEGTLHITVTAHENILSYSIHPLSREIPAEVDGNRLSFNIEEPQKLYIQINDLPRLAIFINPVETDTPRKNDPNVLYFGPGSHNPGRIDLKSNQTVYLAAGSVVNANIRGDSLDNVKIQGYGSLNGNILVSNTSHLSVSGIFVRNTSFWSNTLVNCDHSSYDNVKVFTYKSVWGIDGINPVSSKNFTINDCFIRTRDDCIAVKSMHRFAGIEVDNVDTDSLTITRNVLVGWSHADGVTFGFELNGGRVRNVLVKDNDIISSSGQGRTGGHSAFSIVCDGPSKVRNIRFEDIRVEHNIEYKNLEIIATEGERYGNGQAGSIDGVYLKNIRWSNTEKPFVIAGIPTSIVRNVTFEHCYVGSTLLTSLEDADFQTEFVQNIKFLP